MARTPFQFNDTELAWEEKLIDEDGDNVFIEEIKVTERNGNTLQDQNPDWIRAENGQKTIKSDGSVERIITVIFDPTPLFPVNTYTIELTGSDGKAKSTRQLFLTIDGIPRIGANFQYHNKNDDTSSGFDGEFSITSQVKRKSKELDPINQFGQVNEVDRKVKVVDSLNQFGLIGSRVLQSSDISNTSVQTEKFTFDSEESIITNTTETDKESDDEVDSGFVSTTIETDTN